MSSRQDIAALREENRSLKRTVQKLTTLNKIIMTMGASDSLERVLELVLEDCVQYVDAEKGLMLLHIDGASSIRATIGLEKGRDRPELMWLGEQLASWMLMNKKPLRVKDMMTDSPFAMPPNQPCECRSLLCVPMTLKDGTMGLIALFNKRSGGWFSSEDEALLLFIADQSVGMVERFRLMDGQNRLARMDEEIQLAQHIQNYLYPADVPNLDDYMLFARAIPAKDVGGDYYDFIPIDDRKLAICIGDISGKGLGAALLMANLQATVRSQTMMTCSSRKCYHQAHESTACFIDNCVERINSLLFRSTTPEKYATMFYGVLDVASHEFVFTNAGNTQPFLFKENGGYMKLTDNGLPIGLFDGVRHESRRIQLREGEQLLFYSDGVTECVNDRDEAYGEERLIDTVTGHLDLSPEQLANTIINDVRRFQGKALSHDDLTVVVLQRRPGSHGTQQAT